jgi:zinc protease
MRTKTCIAYALLVVAALGSACTAPRSPGVRDGPAVVREIFPNGVHVLVEERPTSDIVAVQLWVKAGARDEAPREHGLAHYLEHMVFKGTPTRRTDFVDRELERLGGRINASTSVDYTDYHVVLPAGPVAPAIEMLADISTNALLDDQELEREKRVVLEEMRRSDDDPGRILDQRLFEAAFSGHPYGHRVLGSPEVVRNLSRERLLAFYRRQYVPEAFTLVVVGPIDAAEVLAAARRALGHLPRGEVARLPVPSPTELRTSRADIPGPGSFAHLGMAWLGPRLDHADTPAIDVLVTVLGRGTSSRLTQSLRERLGIVNAISARYSALQAAGIITVTAQLEPPNFARVEQEVAAEVRRLRTGGVRDDERARAVTAIEARREFQVETADGRASRLGYTETVWSPESERAYLDRVRAVTPAQLQAAARRYLDPEHYTRVAVVPR